MKTHFYKCCVDTLDASAGVTCACRSGAGLTHGSQARALSGWGAGAHSDSSAWARGLRPWGVTRAVPGWKLWMLRPQMQAGN